jgi:hypothetical protein
MFDIIREVLKKMLPQWVRTKIRGALNFIRLEINNRRYANLSVDQMNNKFGAKGGYHIRNRYVGKNENPRLKEIYFWMAEAVLRALPDIKKVLVAGVAQGGQVISFREQGIESWGFDLCCDNLNLSAWPDALPYLRYGHMASIPFDAEDRFDTLVAIDVFQFVPLGMIPQMIEEIKRLKVKYIVAIISQDEDWIEGHITMKPHKWWIRQFSKYYTYTPIQFKMDDLPKDLYPWNCYDNKNKKLLFFTSNDE